MTGDNFKTWIDRQIQNNYAINMYELVEWDDEGEV